MDDITQTFAVVILSSAVAIVAIMGLSQMHTRRMAALGFCQQPLAGSSDFVWQKCK